MPKTSRRRTQAYSPQELQELLRSVNSGTPLSELEFRLQRSAGGIVAKLDRLSKQDTGTWSPPKIREIIGEYRSNQWRSPRKDPGEVEQSRQRVLDYFREHPDSNRRDAEAAGLGWDLFIAYQGRVNAVRRELALPERGRGTRVPREQRKSRLLAYLQEHPTATAKELAHIGYLHDVLVVYNNCLDAARRDAGVLPAGYISAAQAARELGVSREWVSMLVKVQELCGYRLGRRLYVSVADVDARKGMAGQGIGSHGRCTTCSRDARLDGLSNPPPEPK